MPPLAEAPAATLLVIEDHRGLLEAMTEYLQELGYQCRMAPSVALALEEIGRGPVDVVMADHHLPDGKGLALLWELAAEEDGPELILTTGDREVDAAGIRVLRKPIELPVLVAEVHAAVERRRARARLRARAKP